MGNYVLKLLPQQEILLVQDYGMRLFSSPDGCFQISSAMINSTYIAGKSTVPFFSASSTVQSTCRLTFVLFFVLADEKLKTLAFHFKNTCSISSEKTDNTNSLKCMQNYKQQFTLL